jgi:hypothetical protein
MISVRVMTTEAIERQKLKERDSACTNSCYYSSEQYWFVWQTTGILLMFVRSVIMLLECRIWSSLCPILTQATTQLTRTDFMHPLLLPPDFSQWGKSNTWCILLWTRKQLSHYPVQQHRFSWMIHMLPIGHTTLWCVADNFITNNVW